jgi:hypothetical protein
MDYRTTRTLGRVNSDDEEVTICYSGDATVPPHTTHRGIHRNRRAGVRVRRDPSFYSWHEREHVDDGHDVRLAAPPQTMGLQHVDRGAVRVERVRFSWEQL